MTKRRTAKNTAALWRALEEEQVMPRAVDLPYLSGLDATELLRFGQAWPAMPVTERRKLLQTLVQLAEDDFEMDFGAIFRLALRDSDAEVRAAGIEGLWEDEDLRLLPELMRLFLADAVLEVRIAAAQCLAHFVLLGELQKLPTQLFAQVCQALSLVHRNPAEALELRRRALESLAYASVAELPTLIRAAYTHPEEAMQISAVFAMGRSADPRWKEAVMRQLHHPSPAMRYEAARACGELGAREAVRDLVELTDDVDLEVQEAALWALGQIGGDLARLTLERHLEGRSEALRAAAHEALQEFDFLHGDLDTFFGPPEDFVSESDVPWDFPTRRWAGGGHAAAAEDEDDEDDTEAAALAEDEAAAALFLEDDDDAEDEDDEDDLWDDAFADA